jgi:ABC-type lipoprotein release transport system permease subunit
MGIGVGLTLGAITLQNGMTNEIFDEMVTDTLGHVQLHHPQYPETKRPHFTLNQVNQTIQALEKQEHVAIAIPRVFAFVLAGGETESQGALVMGVDPKREKKLSEIHLEIIQGKWLKEGKSKEAVVGIELARELNLNLGQKVALIGQDGYGSVANDLFTIVGLVESGSVEMDRGGIWIPLETLQSFLALDNQVHEIVVLGQDTSTQSFNPNKTEDLHRLKQQVESALSSFSSSEIKPRLVETWKEASPSTAQLIESQSIGAYLMLMIVFLVSALGILNTLLMAVFERTRELGVLLAIGIAPHRIFAMVVSEAWMLALLASVVGLAIGGGFSFWLVEYGIDFSVQGGQGLSYGGVRLSPRIRGDFDWKWVGIILTALFGVTTLTALWPAWKAARVSPLEAMKADT